MTMDPNEPVRVYSVSDPVEAELVKNALQDEGIRCFLDGDNQAAMPGNPAVSIHVLVEAAHADRARQLIRAHEAHRRR
jgi:hypothetical protein